MLPYILDYTYDNIGGNNAGVVYLVVITRWQNPATARSETIKRKQASSYEAMSLNVSTTKHLSVLAS